MTGPRTPLFTSVRYARRRSWTGVLRYVLLGTAVVLVLVLAVGLALWRYANSRISRVDIPGLADEAQADLVQPIEGTRNILVVGTDTREGLTEQQLEDLGTEAVDGRRTDTIMLVQVSPARERTVLLSFPRDLRVEIPGHGFDKINSVYAKGGDAGPDLLVRTVQGYTGVPVDHYVEIDIAGFLRLTRAIGGVEVCLDQPMVDEPAGVDLPAGCTELDGVEAAGFVRARHVENERFGFGDFGRIARQQYFVTQAMDKVTSAGTLLNPLKLKRLVDVVASSVTTDKDLGTSDLFSLANTLQSMDAEQVETRMVPSYWDGERFTRPYPERAEALFQALRGVEPLPDVGRTAPAELTAGDVTVEVLNGVGREGLAAEVQDFLEARGFEVVGTGNAESFDVATTRVEYPAGERPRAELLAQFLPGAELVEGERAGSDGVTVTMVVGRDWVER